MDLFGLLHGGMAKSKHVAALAATGERAKGKRAQKKREGKRHGGGGGGVARKTTGSSVRCTMARMKKHTAPLFAVAARARACMTVAHGMA